MIDFESIEMDIYQYEIKPIILEQFYMEWDENAEGLCDQLFAETMRWDE